MADRQTFKNWTSLHSGYSNTTLRSWQTPNTIISPNDLIYPIFVSNNPEEKTEIKSMPGQYRLGVDKLVEFLKELVDGGLNTILLFGTIDDDKKDELASAADDIHINPVIQAIEVIDKAYPTLQIACDVCMCAFTSHGHCGILNKDVNRSINNSKSIKRLGEIAAAYAMAGCHIVAPSDMMDGRVHAISEALKEKDLRSKVCIMSYSAKFASCFYGPFRDAASSSPAHGDRRCYQLPAGSSGLAMRATKRDIDEGADIVMVKPGIAYLDIARMIKDRYPDHPLAMYQVSGEYAMLYHAAEKGVFDLQSSVQESLISMKRAGVQIIITYFVPQLLEWMAAANQN